MSTKDPRIDSYIENAAEFARPILQHIRRLVHKASPEIDETLKWSMPYFVHQGIVCNMAAFKHHCALGFWKAKLLFPSEAKAEGAMGHFGRITCLADLPGDDELIRLVQSAVRLNQFGIKATKPARPQRRQELVIPEDLVSALRQHRGALDAFQALSYSHKKEYVEWLTEAKRDETRNRRLETAVEWISQGKSRYWKFAKAG